MSTRSRRCWCLAVLLISGSIGQAREPKQNKDVQVVVEVRFADLDTAVVEQLKENGVLDRGTKEVARSLDNARMIRFMDIVQQDIRTNVMQAPKLTMRNGQKSVIDVVEKQYCVTGLEFVSRNGRVEYLPKMETVPLGVRMKIRSLVSADRRFVRVHLKASLTSLACSEVPQLPITTPGPNGAEGMVTHYIDQPQIETAEVDRSMVIHDGNTRVLMGPIKQVQANRDREVPILGQIPFVGPLFHITDRPWETHQLLVLVTSRILIPQEMEEKAPDAAAGRAKKDVEERAAFRTPLSSPAREVDAVPRDTPDEARILRELPPPEGRPGIYDVSRDDIQIVKEKLPDCRWKCTVYYIDSITGHWPFPFHWSQPRTQVVYITPPAARTASPERAGE
jgi:hypothetical protein